MRRIVLGSVLVLPLLTVFPLRAGAQGTGQLAASADQALGALAQVIVNRAKAVAAETIQDNLANAVCGKQLPIPTKVGVSDYPASVEKVEKDKTYQVGKEVWKVTATPGGKPVESKTSPEGQASPFTDPKVADLTWTSADAAPACTPEYPGIPPTVAIGQSYKVGDDIWTVAATPGGDPVEPLTSPKGPSPFADSAVAKLQAHPEVDKLVWTLETPLTLSIGGGTACLADHSQCHADDVFVQTCAELTGLNFTITDPTLLKTFAQEAVQFVLRVAAHNLQQVTYDQYGLDLMASYIYQLAIDAKGGQLSAVTAIADTANFTAGVRKRTQVVPETVASLLRGLDGLQEITQLAWTAQDMTCNPGGKAPAVITPACAYHKLFPNPATLTTPATCQSFLTQSQARLNAFNAFFTPTYQPFLNVPCSPSINGSDVTQCRVAELSRFLDGLYKVQCSNVNPKTKNNKFTDGDSGLSASDLRQMDYLFYKEDAIYTDAAKWANGVLAGVPGTGVPVDGTTVTDDFTKVKNDFTSALVKKSAIVSMTPAAIGAVFDMAGAGLKVQQSSAAAFASFFVQLQKDAQAAAQAQIAVSNNQTASCDDLRGGTVSPTNLVEAYSECFLNGAALSWLKRSDWATAPNGSPDLAGFRDALKSLVALPIFVAPMSQSAVNADASIVGKFIEDIQNLVALAQGFQSSDPKTPLTPDQIMAQVSKLLKLMSTIGSQVQAVLPPGTDAQVFKYVQLGLSTSSDMLASAAQQDWVGMVVVGLNDLVSTSLPPEVSSALQFIHVLMSVYQAKTIQDAQAVFSANLEQISSRKQRFHERGAMDLSALVGGGAGLQVDWTTTSPGKPNAAFGLFVPFGFQVTSGHFGALIYPIDLGAYLSSSAAWTNSESITSSTIQWYDALRFGAAFLGRPWASIPVDFVLSADYRPAFATGTQVGSQEFRVQAQAVLELPLFLLH